MADEKRSSVDLPRPMRVFLLINVLGAAVCLIVELITRHFYTVKVYRGPFYVGMRFMDLTSFQPRFRALHTLAFFDPRQPFLFNYPAPATVIYSFFFAFGKNALPAYFACAATGLLLASAAFAYALHRQGIPIGKAVGFTAAMCAVAFPFWFCLERSNIEIFLFLLLAIAVWAYASGRLYWAAVLIGLAASIKILPGVYFGLFLSRRQFRPMLAGLVTLVVATALGLRYVGPTAGQAYHGLAAGVSSFADAFILSFKPEGIGFDHSLLGVYKRFVPPEMVSERVAKLYAPIVAALGALVYFGRIVWLPFLNQFLCLTIAILLFPPVSFEYTLMHLYLALGLLVFALLRARGPAADTFTQSVMPFFVLLGCLAMPLAELILHGVRFGGQVQSVLLLALFVFALARRLPSLWDTQPATS